MGMKKSFVIIGAVVGIGIMGCIFLQQVLQKSESLVACRLA
jgi:hypothetical protein